MIEDAPSSSAPLEPPEIVLESAAVHCRASKLCTPDQATALSQAISLKRIADLAAEGVEQLTRIAQHLDNIEQNQRKI